MMVYFFARYAQGEPATREAAVIAASLVGQAVAFGFQALLGDRLPQEPRRPRPAGVGAGTDRGDARGPRRHRPAPAERLGRRPRIGVSRAPRRRLMTASSSLRAKLIISTTSALPRAAVSSSSPPRVAALASSRSSRTICSNAPSTSPDATIAARCPVCSRPRRQRSASNIAAVAERQRRLLERAPLAPGQHARDLLRDVVQLLLGQDAPAVVGIDRANARHDQQPQILAGDARDAVRPRAQVPELASDLPARVLQRLRQQVRRHQQRGRWAGLDLHARRHRTRHVDVEGVLDAQQRSRPA